MSLTGSIKIKKTSIWGELIEAFVMQLSYNTMIDVTLRDLETNKQKNEETFFEFLIRWRGKASKMINRLTEKDQVNMTLKNLFLVYYNRLFSSPLMNFKQLCDYGIKIEMLSMMVTWTTMRGRHYKRRHSRVPMLAQSHPILQM